MIAVLWFIFLALGLRFVQLIARGHKQAGLSKKRLVNLRLIGLTVLPVYVGAALIHQYIFHDRTSLAIGAALLLVADLALWFRLPDWNPIGRQFMSVLVASIIGFLTYALVATFSIKMQGWQIGLSLGLWTLELLAAILTIYYAFEMLNALSRQVWRRRTGPWTEPNNYWPKVSIHVPAHNEPPELVIQTLDALTKLTYPNYEIVMIDDNTDDDALWRPVMDFCKLHRIKVYHLQSYPGFKSGALNFALTQMAPDVEIIGVVDADYIVSPEYLNETVPYFQNRAIAFLQTPQAFIVPENDRFQSDSNISQRFFFEVGMLARNERNSIIFCGTMGLIRRSALKRIGGWDEWCITEDAEASLRLLARGYEGLYIKKVYGRGLLPNTFDDTKKQRYRWAFGSIQILKRYFKMLVTNRYKIKGTDGKIVRRKTSLTPSQRIDYLFHGMHWYISLLTLLFTAILAILGYLYALNINLEFRPILIVALLMPVFNIVIGIVRTLWGIKVSCECSYLEAWRVFMMMLALNFAVAQACVLALVKKRGTFLRTPKFATKSGVVKAIQSTIWETSIGLVLLVLLPVLLSARWDTYTQILSIFIGWHALIFFAALWLSLSQVEIEG
jgi:cellulose synthase/poly-beta-1,6-N-acetylglucosamine synthase-like glycosyltransferase